MPLLSAEMSPPMTSLTKLSMLLSSMYYFVPTVFAPSYAQLVVQTRQKCRMLIVFSVRMQEVRQDQPHCKQRWFHVRSYAAYDAG